MAVASKTRGADALPSGNQTLRFDNRVAVITGAGGGLGRAYAVLFGSLGAKVVVNDLGGPLAGGPSDAGGARPADQVVQEIRAGGGEAMANYDSVSERGEAIIDAAMERYGRVDVLINNAGILRDKSFGKMSERDWDMTLAVHVKGAFRCCKAVWPIMLRQQYGRILNIASAAGLYGNFGQANYGTAKLALVGLTKTLAIEGARRNIHCNVIAPLAGTRMTETIMAPEIVAALRPEHIAPIAAYLSHEACPDNGEVYECGAGWVARLRWQRSEGQVFAPSFSLDDVHRHWSRVKDFTTGSCFPTSMQESLQMVTQSIGSGAAAPVPGPVGAAAASNPDRPVETAAARAEPRGAGEKLLLLLGEFFKLDSGASAAAACQKAPYKFVWVLTKPGDQKSVKYTYTVDLRGGSGRVIEGGDAATADATFTMSEPDFVHVCTGALNPQLAFMQGKMRIKGNMRAATAFTPNLFPKITEEILAMPMEQAVNHYLAAAGQPPAASGRAAPVAGATGQMLQSEAAIKLLAAFMESDAGRRAAAKIDREYQFDLLPAGSKGTQTPVSFVINFKGKPHVGRGKAAKPDASFTLKDEDFMKLVAGKLNPRTAFMQGKLRIKGSIPAAMKFDASLFPKIAAL